MTYFTSKIGSAKTPSPQISQPPKFLKNLKMHIFEWLFFDTNYNKGQIFHVFDVFNPVIPTPLAFWAWTLKHISRDIRPGQNHSQIFVNAGVSREMPQIFSRPFWTRRDFGHNLKYP